MLQQEDYIKKQQEELMRLMQEFPDLFNTEDTSSIAGLIGQATSPGQVLNAEAAVQDFEPLPQQQEPESVAVGPQEEDQQTEEKPWQESQAALLSGNLSKEDSDRFRANIDKQNKKVQEESKGIMQKIYDETLTPENKLEVDFLENEIDTLLKDENNFATSTIAITTPLGTNYEKTEVLKDEAKEKLTGLQGKLNEIAKPAKEIYLNAVNKKLETLEQQEKALQKIEIQEHKSVQGGGILSETNERQKLTFAKNYLVKSKKLLEAGIEGSNGWQAALDNLTNPDFYRMNLHDTYASFKLLGIARRFNKGKELTSEDIALLDAYTLLEDVQTSEKIGIRGNYSAFNEAIQTIPWMVQFALTNGFTTGLIESTKGALLKAGKKYLKRGVLTNVATKAVASVGSGVTGAVVQGAIMPQTAADFALRKTGRIELDRDSDLNLNVFTDAEGQVVGVHMGKELENKVLSDTNEVFKQILGQENFEDRLYTKEELKNIISRDNIRRSLNAEQLKSLTASLDYLDMVKPLSWAKAAYQAYGTGAIEAGTERMGIHFQKGTKFLSRGARTLFKRATGKALPRVPKGPLSENWKTFSKTVGFNGFFEEMFEEEVAIPLNALFIGDSKYSDLLSSEHQLKLLSTIGIVSGGMGLLGGGLNLSARLRNKEYFKSRAEQIKMLRELDKDPTSSLLLSTSPKDALKLRAKEDALRKDGKIEEADALSQQIMFNQIMRAFDTNTTEEFEEALKGVIDNPKATPEVKKNAQMALIDFNTLNRTYKQFSKLPNKSTIMRLQANKVLARRAIQEIDNQIVDENLEAEVEAEINALIKRGIIKNVDFNTSGLFDIDYSDKSGAIAQQNFLDELAKANIETISNYKNLMMKKRALEELQVDNRLLFNEQVSSEFQQKIKDEQDVFTHINNDSELQEITRAEREITIDKEKASKRFDEIVSKRKGTLSSERIKEIKDEFFDVIARTNSRYVEERKAKAIAAAEKRKAKLEKKEETPPVEKSKVNIEIKNAAEDLASALEKDIPTGKESDQATKIEDEAKGFFDLNKEEEPDYIKQYVEGEPESEENQALLDSMDEEKIYIPEEAFKLLEKHVKSKFLKIFIKKILPFAKKLGTTVRFEAKNKEVPEKAIGVFRGTNNTIYLSKQSIAASFRKHKKNKTRRGNTDSLGNYFNYVLLHELIHSFTKQAVFLSKGSNTFVRFKTSEEIKNSLTAKQLNAIKKLEEIFNFLKKQDILVEEYGLTNESELLSELSNEAFVSKLKSIKTPKEFKYEGENIFESIINLIRDLLGLESKDENISKELYTILSDLVADSSFNNTNLVQDIIFQERMLDAFKYTGKLGKWADDALEEGLSEERKNNAKENVKLYYDTLTRNNNNKPPTFYELMDNFISIHSLIKGKQYFNNIKIGWELNNYAKTDFKSEYDKLFSSLREITQRIVDEKPIYETENTTEQGVHTEEGKRLKAADVGEIEGHSETGTPIKRTQNLRTISPDLKLGFLSIEYKETIDEKGESNKQSTSDELVEDTFTNSKPLLDFDKFLPGTKLQVRIPDSDAIRNLPISHRVDGKKKITESYEQWIERKEAIDPNFTNTEEYLQEIPIMVYTTASDKPLAYVHAASWYDTHSVGYELNKPKQAEVIEQAVDNVTEFRKYVIDNEGAEITITDKQGLAFHQLSKEKPLLTIQEANPQSILVVATSNKVEGLETSLKEKFQNKKRKVVGDTSRLVSGKTYHMRRMGTENGQETWMTFEVLRGKKIPNPLVEGDTRYVLTDEDYQTVRWALLASFSLTPFKSYFKRDVNIPTGLDKDLARKIADDILEETSWDITQWQGLKSFLEQYIYFKEYNYGNMIDKLLNKKIEVATELSQHTSLQALGINPDMIKIESYKDENGTEKARVIPLGMKYERYLKETLKTPVKSFNIGTKESPKWVTAIHPTLNYSYSGQVGTKEKQAEEKSPTPVAEEQETTNESLQQSAQDLLDELGLSDLTLDLSVPLKNEGPLKKIHQTTKGLTIIQEFQIVDFLFNKTSDEVGLANTNTIDINKLERDLKDSYNEIINPSKEKIKVKLAELEAEFEKNPKDIVTNALIGKFSKVLITLDNIKKNWSNLKEKAYKEAKILIEDEEENTSLREKAYTKTSLEENSQEKTSYRLRKFFRSIMQRTPEGKVKRGFLGLPTFVNKDEVYTTIGQILMTPTETPSDFDSMIEKLSENIKSHPWLQDVIDRLKGVDEDGIVVENAADNQLRFEFVTNMAKHALTMKFVMYTATPKGGYELKIYDTNSHEIVRLIKKAWKTNFIVGNLVRDDQQFYAIDKDQAVLLLKEMKRWKNPEKNDRDVMRLWLKNNFGIALSEDTYNHLVDNGLFYSGTHYEYREMFKGNRTLFGLLQIYLERVSEAKDLNLEENDNLHPSSDMGGILNTLALLESKYTKQSTTLSFRDNGKNIWGMTPPKFATDRILKLKQFQEDSNPFLEDLLELSMSSESYILKLLQNEEDFRAKFNVHHAGITALKEFGRKQSEFSSITDLSDFDKETLSFGALQDLKQGPLNSGVDKSGNIVKLSNVITMRIGTMLFPTMSDKSTMLLLESGIFEFFKNANNSFAVDLDGKINLKKPVLNLLFNQIVKPELKRITNFNKNIKETNLINYDIAAQHFHYIPEINNIKNEDGVRIIELMAVNPELYDAAWIEENFKEKFHDVLQSTIEAEVTKKKEVWKDAVVTNTSNEITDVKFFDKEYMRQLNATDLVPYKFDLALYDFVLNSFLSTSNIHAIVAGDPAQFTSGSSYNKFEADNEAIMNLAESFGKEKLFKTYNTHGDFLDHLDEVYASESITKDMYDNMLNKIKPSIFTINDEIYAKTAKKIGVNIGKRLAYLIAPGVKMANVFNDSYLQIFLEDPITITENSKYLIGLYYGESGTKKAIPILDRYDKTDNEAQKKQIRKTLSKMFPKLEAYFNIESADGQEYSTVKEHIDVLERLGRIPDNLMKDIREKMKQKDYTFTKRELGFVLQPIKPVYTGQIMDKEQDMMRVMYIKSSSFPLVPQMTRNSPLDALRVKMEELQEQEKLNVRASYQSANKLGGTKSKVNLNDAASLNNLLESSLILDRDNFRIQQDVPFKSDLKKHDQVSMGTQIFKLLFGDGMLDLDGFKINGKTLTGKKLYDYFNKVFGELIDIKRNLLFNELGLDERGLPINKRESIAKLQEVLKKEATDRNFPRQDIAGLQFVEKMDSNDEMYYDFKLPLWISANSNRYESLLNAIVTNRVLKQKMPGNSFVVGSEYGLNYSENITDIENPSDVIFLGDYRGGELKGVQRRDGSFKYAQIMVTSKFKDIHGNLIDLLQVDKNNEYVYIKKEDGRFLLKTEMFDQELIENFTFRTPTSFHASASIVEIAAILPAVNGDLMIVPKNFIAQKGLDFDVDKETAYQLAHFLNPRTNKIEVLSQSHVDILTKGLRKRLDDIRKHEKLPGEEVIIDEPTKNLLIAIIGQEEYDDILNTAEASLEDKIQRQINKINQRLLENEFIKVHLAVFANPNEEVQRKINRILTMEFASRMAEDIEELEESSEDFKYFSILSDEYQKSKMFLGTAANMAIGVYSNAVTFHSLAQQVNANAAKNEDLRPKLIQKLGPDLFTTYKVTIGKDTKGEPISATTFGELKTLDGSRYISEVLAEKQNTATDNQKEQILGRVNINRITIGVDSMLTLLGFDKGNKVNDKETSIPYLFLSQPIIKDYVKEIQNAQRITAEYNPNMDAEVKEKLTKKYSENYPAYAKLAQYDSEEFLKMTERLSSKNMMEAIETKGENIPGMQIAVLNQFLILNQFSKKLTSIQSLVNTKDLGKSIIESNTKYEKLNNLPGAQFDRDSDFGISNATHLIGEYQEIDNLEDPRSIPKGWHVIGTYLDKIKIIRPTTPQGHLVVNGIKIGNDLWNKYFPYQDKYIGMVLEEIMKITDSRKISDKMLLQLKYDIMKEIKRYINSYHGNKIFNQRANKERQRLFTDSETNESLAKYLNTLRYTSLRNVEDAFKEGISAIQTDKLIARFDYQLDPKTVSLIFYNNARGTSYDEDYLYNAIPQMVLNNKKLPDFNGKPYDTKMLAGDLAAYSFLEGGVQEAIQYAKHIPLEYLEGAGFIDVLQEKFSIQKDPHVFEKILGIDKMIKVSESDVITYPFVRQFIQHFPEKAKQYSKNQEITLFQDHVFKGKVLVQFVLASDKDRPKFITKRNKGKHRKKQDKFTLFQHEGAGVYKKISILGIHGMSEYVAGELNAVSILEDIKLDDIKPNTVTINTNREQPVEDIFGIKEGKVADILQKIKAFKGKKYKHFETLIRTLEPYAKEDISIKVEDTAKDGLKKVSGRFILEKASSTIIIDTDTLNSNNHEFIARAFVHEYLHALSARELSKYFDAKTGKQLTPDLPPHITRLLRVYNATKEALKSDLERQLKDRPTKPENLEMSSNSINDEYSEVGYSTKSIFEFLTVALTEPEFQKRMKKIEYLNSKQSLWSRFTSAVSEMFVKNNNIGLIGEKENNIAREALIASLEVIHMVNKPLKSKQAQQYKVVGGTNTTSEDEERIRKLNEEIKKGLYTKSDRTKDIEKGLGDQGDSLFGLDSGNLQFHINTIGVVTKFLEEIGIKQRMVTDLLMYNGKVVNNAVAMTNFMEGTIDIAERERLKIMEDSDMTDDEKAVAMVKFWQKVNNKLPEEAAHWWYRLLEQDSELKRALLTSKKSWSKKRELRKTEYGKLSLYQNGNEVLLEEAIGQLIAEAMNRIETKNGSPEDYSFFRKFLEWFNKMVEKYWYLRNNKDPFEIAAMKILSSDMTDLMSLDEYQELHDIVFFDNQVSKQTIEPIDYSIIGDIGELDVWTYTEPEGPNKGEIQEYFRFHSGAISPHPDYYYDGPFEVQEQQIWEKTSPVFKSIEKMDAYIRKEFPIYEQRKREVVQEVMDTRAFMHKLLNNTYKKRTRWLSKTLAKYYEVYDRGLTPLKHHPLPNVNTALPEPFVKFNKDEEEAYKKTHNYTIVTPVIRSMDKVLEKYKKNPIPLSQPLNVAGVKKQELEVLNAVLNLIKEENQSIKSISSEDFAFEVHNYMEMNYALGFADEQTYLEYGVRNTFEVPNKIVKEPDFNVDNLTEEEIRNMTPAQRIEAAHYLGYTGSDYGVQHNTVSMRFNGVSHTTQKRKSQHYQISKKGKYGRNQSWLPSAFASLTYFYSKNQKYKDAAMLHQIQNDNIEAFRLLGEEDINVDLIISKYLKGLDKSLENRLKSIENSGLTIKMNNYYSPHQKGIYQRNLEEYFRQFRYHNIAENVAEAHDFDNLLANIDRELIEFKQWAEEQKNLVVPYPIDERKEFVDRTYTRKWQWDNMLAKGGIKALLTKEELSDLEELIKRVNLEVDTYYQNEDPFGTPGDIIASKEQRLTSIIGLLARKMEERLDKLFGKELGNNFHQIQVPFKPRGRTMNGVMQRGRSEDLNESIKWFIKYNNEAIKKRFVRAIADAKQDLGMAYAKANTINFYDKISKITELQFKRLIENIAYNEKLFNDAVEKLAEKELESTDKVESSVKAKEELVKELTEEEKRLKAEAEKRKETHSDIINEFKGIMETEGYYFNAIVSHMINKHIRQMGRDVPIYFSGQQVTNLIQKDDRTAAIYAGPHEVKYTREEADAIKVEVAKALGLYQPPGFMSTDAELLEALREFKRIPPRDEWEESNLDKVMKKTLSITNGQPIETGALYNMMSKVPGIKLVWQDTIPGIKYGAGGYRIDLSKWNPKGDFLFGLDMGMPVENDKITDDTYIPAEILVNLPDICD